jgi:hypothetical protein
MKLSLRYVPILFFVAGLLAFTARATDFSSTNFIIRDPILEIGGGGEMTSSNFRLLGSISQIGVGTSTASSFNVSAGFLYFPTVTKPTVTATAGNGQVSLSWTASQGFLGWTVSGYDVGQSTVSGGPYTYTPLGNVTSSTRSGLTNGIAYYFVIRPQDAFGNAIATSSQVSATPTAPSPPPPAPPPSGGGGGGGGGGILIETPVTGVKFSGIAYPFADVTFLRDGTVLKTLKANSAAEFSYTVSDVTPGIYSFTVFGEDKKGIKSVALSFSITVIKNVLSNIGNIIIPPTIELDRTDLSRGDILTAEGFAAPNAQVESLTQSEEIMKKASSSPDGSWSVKVDTSPLEDGFHVTKAKTGLLDGRTSTFSAVKTFRIGKGFPKTRGQCQGADFNLDGRVNLTDFSIMLFFWKSTDPANPCVDINADRIVDLTDFSILLFQWTG